MLYTTGDTVLILSDEGCIGPGRKEFCGTIMTIDYVIHGEYEDDSTYYEMVEDGNAWMWFNEDIEKKIVVQKKKVIKFTNLPII